MISEAMRVYHQWLSENRVDEQTKEELTKIAEQPDEIQERFHRDLEFGTGGLRGIIGAGSNRINQYTVARATQAFAQFLKEQHGGSEAPISAVIAYDCRHQSPEFALRAALVLAANGIKAMVFESLRPTPELSFAVRHLGASGGIVITASHNPPEYNGYKVYDADGCQLVPQSANKVMGHIAKLGAFDASLISQDEAESRGLLTWISSVVDDRYIEAVQAVSAPLEQEVAQGLKVVYTPLHGAGNQLVQRVLKERGFSQLFVVSEQEVPDPQFRTTSSPNPEEQVAYDLAIKLAGQVDADLIIATDPDSDRLGAAVKQRHSTDYTLLNGNQLGAILISFLLEQMSLGGNLPTDGIVIKTIVTSDLGARIAQGYGLEVKNTLTGFKYIGEQIGKMEQAGSPTFVFGYEESCGFLASTHCRDKDAVQAALLLCEAAAYYKIQGKTLEEQLERLYEKYGYMQEKLLSYTWKGLSGQERMKQVMGQLRQSPPVQLGGIDVEAALDYMDGIDELPRENVLKFKLVEGSWVALRPSGTEPKLKVYISVIGDSKEDTSSKLARLTKEWDIFLT